MELKRLKQNRLGFSDANQTVSHYTQAMIYDFRIIEDFLRKRRHSNSLIIILGDHQPSLAASQNKSLVPLHILTRDVSLSKAIKKYGFTKGLTHGKNINHNLNHEGLFSMLVSAMIVRDSQIAEPFVRFFPKGIQISGLNR